MLILSLTFLTFLLNGCLAANERVINGQVAEPHQFPHHVGIFIKFRVPVLKPRLYCGGSIINENWVLTAAHCVPTKYIHLIVKAGKHNINIEEVSEQVRNVITAVVHPAYKHPITSKRLIAANDIAILKVDQSFVFNAYVGAAAMPNYGFADVTSGVLAGWGSTSDGVKPTFPNELHYNKALPIVDVTTCTDAINEGVWEIEVLEVKITENQTCSGPVGESFGACILDGGSGLVQTHVLGRHEMVGVVSWNQLPCGYGGIPTVYTRVSAYRNWIDQVITTN